MWVVVHTYVGLALASVLHLPLWLVALIVLASHVLLDLVPHWDYTADGRHVFWAALDVFAALVTMVVLLALSMPAAVVVIGAISAAPDIDVLGSALDGRQSRHFFPSHWRRFPHGRCRPAPGIVLQLAIVALSAAVVVWVGL